MDRDLLYSRIVEGDSGAANWRLVEKEAGADASAWRELALRYRDQVEMTQLMQHVAALTDESVQEYSPAARRVEMREVLTSSRDWRASAGWLVAAVILAAWIVGVGPGSATRPVAQQPLEHAAGFIPVHSADEALKAYLEMGQREDRVVQEWPQHIILQSQPAPSGPGFELLYVRQIVERTIVPDLYQLQGADENGHPVLVRHVPRIKQRS